jgi:hypothetical protein
MTVNAKPEDITIITAPHSTDYLYLGANSLGGIFSPDAVIPKSKEQGFSQATGVQIQQFP